MTTTVIQERTDEKGRIHRIEIPLMTFLTEHNLEQVVRCKDCRWGREVCGNIECSVDCNLPPEYHGYDWFCPNGEKMDEVEK